MSKDLESNLADCISALCEVGFSPTKDDILDLVAEYLKDKNIVVTKFKDNRPGYDWFQGFKKRYELSLKKGNMNSSAQNSATGNPFITHDLSMNMIFALIKFGTAIKVAFLPIHKSVKFVSKKVEIPCKVTCGARRDNITTLAVCNADGKALDPLIILQRKNRPNSWRPEKPPLKYIFYGISESDSLPRFLPCGLKNLLISQRKEHCY